MTGYDNNSMIARRLLITFDYDLQDVTQMLFPSLIPFLELLRNE